MILSILIPLIFSNSCIRKFIISAKSGVKEYLYSANFSLSKEERNKLINSLTKKKIIYNSNIVNFIEPKKYNIILFTIESLNDAVATKELMPNVYNFLNESIRFQNYFNHTASTVRGIRGQLTSFFQIREGWRRDKASISQNSILAKEFIRHNSLVSLVNILNDLNYNTYVQLPTSKNHSFNILIKSLGYKFDFNMEDVKVKSPTYAHSEISDKDSFSLLNENLDSLKSPFFYHVYTFETHFNSDSKTIKYKDGKNANLNKFYAFDYYFGQFFEKFKKSNLKDNTIIILTADHAHFPVDNFIETFKNTNKMSIDKIVLGIYKFGNRPAVLDVNGRNSLALAPTICDILGIKEYENSFLGHSLFDNNVSKIEYFEAIGFDYYKSLNGVVEKIDDNPKYKDEIEEIFKYQRIGG